MAPLDAVFDLSIRGCGQAIGGARARREVTATSQTQRRPPPMGLLLRQRAPVRSVDRPMPHPGQSRGTTEVHRAATLPPFGLGP
jgi:hypothetical protein